MDSVKILQWNCRSAIANKGNLEYLLLSENIDIAALSETWFKPTSVISFPGYNIVRRDRPDGKGGVAILVKNVYDFIVLDQIQGIRNIAHVTIKLKLKNKPFISITSVYIKPNTRVSEQEYSTLFSTLPRPYLIVGDFNSHNSAWGGYVTDANGKILLDSIDVNNIVYLNDGSPTMVGRLNARESAIDISLCTPDVAGLFSWKTYEDPCGSDHLPILIEGNFSPFIKETHCASKWQINKADWKEFRTEIDGLLGNKTCLSYAEFIEALNRAAEKSIPRSKDSNQKKSRHKHIGKTWWNAGCQEAVNRRKTLYKQYIQNPNINNLLAFKKQDAISKKIFNEAKRNKWREFCSSLNKNVPIKEVWSKVNVFKNRGKRQARNSIQEDDEWIEPFYSKLTPCWVQNKQVEACRTSQAHPLLNKFNDQELNQALKNHCNTAPGVDNIHYAMLYNLPKQSKKLLLTVLNSIWLGQSEIPEQWYEYIVVPILKPGKPPDSPDSYRPISLSSCVLKSYERMIKTRIEHWLEKQNKLPSSQYGFRKGKSLQDNVGNLVSDIQIAFTRNRSITAAFLDIKGAYDNVVLSLLSEKMVKVGLPEKLTKNIINMYINRKIHLRLNNRLLSSRSTSLGLPQGSILSPLLYIIYSQDIQSRLDGDIKILQFADDIVVYHEAKEVHQTILGLSRGIEQIHCWAKSNGLSISPEKSKVCTFTRRRLQIPPSITLHTFKMPYKSEVMYLGIHLDIKLNWKSHINYIVSKAENSLNVLRAFCGSKWGCDPNIALLFFRSFTRSILDFGAIFYENASKTHLEKINRVFNKGLRLCGGFLKSTPIIAMQAELVEPPPYLRHRYLSDRFVLSSIARHDGIVEKLQSLSELTNASPYWRKKKLPTLVSSFNEISQFKNQIHITDGIPLYTINYQIFSFPIKICHIEDPIQCPLGSTNAVFTNTLRDRWRNHQYIFTDGSKNDREVGSAYYHSNSNNCKLIKLQSDSSIFTAELIAIKEAMLYCLEYSDNKFVLFTDSKSSVEALQNIKMTAKSNYILYEILDINMHLVMVNKEVTIVWLRGHAGIVQNEEVDKMAKRAAKEGQQVEIKLPYTDFNRRIKHQLKIAWQSDYEKSTTGTKYKSIQCKIPSRPWFHNESRRQFVSTICRIRTGHAMSQQYKFRISRATTEDCICGELGDLQHIFLDCPFYNTSLLMNELSSLNIALPFNFLNLVALNSISVYRLLHKFLRTNNIEL